MLSVLLFLISAILTVALNIINILPELDFVFSTEFLDNASDFLNGVAFLSLLLLLLHSLKLNYLSYLLECSGLYVCVLSRSFLPYPELNEVYICFYKLRFQYLRCFFKSSDLSSPCCDCLNTLCFCVLYMVYIFCFFKKIRKRKVLM